MKQKRSLSLHGHATSVALEPAFWMVVDEVAASRKQSVASLIRDLDDRRLSERYTDGLASFIRVWCVEELRRRSDP